MSKKSIASFEDLMQAIVKQMSPVEVLQTSIRLEISRMIREARKRSGMSQKEFASKMGVTQSLVSRWESGECNYTVDTLAQICLALNLTMNCPLAYEEIPAIKVAAKIVEVNRWDGKTVSSKTTADTADFLLSDAPDDDDDYMGAA